MFWKFKKWLKTQVDPPQRLWWNMNSCRKCPLTRTFSLSSRTTSRRPADFSQSKWRMIAQKKNGLHGVSPLYTWPNQNPGFRASASSLPPGLPGLPKFSERVSSVCFFLATVSVAWAGRPRGCGRAGWARCGRCGCRAVTAMLSSSPRTCRAAWPAPPRRTTASRVSPGRAAAAAGTGAGTRFWARAVPPATPRGRQRAGLPSLVPFPSHSWHLSQGKSTTCLSFLKKDAFVSAWKGEAAESRVQSHPQLGRLTLSLKQTKYLLLSHGKWINLQSCLDAQAIYWGFF